MATVTAWHTTNEIRIRLAKHVLGLSHAFHRQHTPGELIQRVDGDVTSVSDFMGRVIPRAAGALFMVVGMIGVLIVVDWRLALGATVYVAVAVARRRPRPAPRRRRVIRRDGLVRPAVRRYRGAADRGRGPARRTAPAVTRCGGSSRTAPTRWAVRYAARRRSCGCGGASTARSPPDRSCRWSSARCWSAATSSRRRRVPAVPVRAAARPAAGGHGRPAGDRAEGQRRDGARHRPAGRRARHPRRRHDDLRPAVR